VYDPHNDETSEFEYDIYDDEYDEYYEDEYYEDEFYDDEPVYADYEVYNAPPNARLDDYPAGIIYVDEVDEDEGEDVEEDFYAQERFWTQRRIVIAVVVVLMVISLFAPQALQMIQIANDGNTFVPVGPTPTALPSV